MSILMGENTLETHMILFELKKSFLRVSSESIFFLNKMSKTEI